MRNRIDPVFRTYFHGKGKQPIEPVKDAPGHPQYAVVNDDSFGAVLSPDYIDISFDYADPARISAMIRAKQWRCMVLENPANHHIHTFWKLPRQWNSRDGKDKTLACGILADIHHGSTYIPLKVDGVKRTEVQTPPVAQMDEVPAEFWPVASDGTDLLGMAAGGGRNDALSSWCMKVARKVKNRETVRKVCETINEYVFADPLPAAELETILRDETFDKVAESDHQKEVLPLAGGMTAAELYQTDVKPVEFIVKDLLPVGLNILASPPKYGKSFMCLDLALSVANGRPFLNFPTNKAGVLYLALEDRFDRLKQRMLMILPAGEQPPESLFLQLECNSLENGFIEQLQMFIREHPVKLIIVDTFVKVRGGVKRNESAYNYDSREAGTIKKFADENGISVLLVTHTRKGIDPNDPFANINGTFGIAGAADDMIVLTKEKRADNLTKMSITGRDVTPEDYAITFDKEHGRWMRQEQSYDLAIASIQTQLEFADYVAGNFRKTIVKMLETADGHTWKGQAAEILARSKEYGTPIAMTSHQLGKYLARAGSWLAYDHIVYTPLRNGTAATTHKFELLNNS